MPGSSYSGCLSQFKAWNKVRAATGYRSKLEVQVAALLENVEALYEPIRIPYQISATAHYKPDWILPEQAIVLEAKGEFKTSDRQKMLLVKQQYPDLDIRLVFGRSATRIGSRSKTTYKMWCARNGFPCCDVRSIPPSWLTHTPTAKAKKALEMFLKDTSHVQP